MTALNFVLARAGLGVPRLSGRILRRWLLALDALHRERVDLTALDDAALRDIGVTRAEVAGALSRPDEHLRLILLRGGDQL